MSNAQFPTPVTFSESKIQIVPCFKPLVLIGGAQSEERQAAMMKRGSFIYDGWIPIQDWSFQNLEKIVSTLDDLVNLFSVVGNYFAYWEPKYIITKKPAPSHLIFPDDLQALAKTRYVLDILPKADEKAINLCSAWIANALRDESPVQRFLLLFVSIESLVTYIERESSIDSPLRLFARDKITKAKRKERQESCIKGILDSNLEPTQAIQQAYFQCVTGSKSMLEEHLDRIFSGPQASNIIFREKVAGKTLWTLRNEIAHGSLNILSEQETAFLSARLSPLENIARDYLRTILATLAGMKYFPPTRQPILTIPASQGMGSPGFEYMGPTDMADYYADVESLSSSFVRFSGESGTLNLNLTL